MTILIFARVYKTGSISFAKKKYLGVKSYLKGGNILSSNSIIRLAVKQPIACENYKENISVQNEKIITVLLADDHPLARAGIRKLLIEANDLEIIGEAEDGFQVQELVAQLRPQVLLLDLKMPGPRPAELEKWVRENHPETVTLVLTSHDRDAYLSAMMEAGASGYMDKNIKSEQLISAIRRAVSGEILFDKAQQKRANQWQEDVGKKIELLTHQEHAILILLAQGMDNQTMAARLSIAEKTIAFHLKNIFTKLQVESRLQAALWAKDHLSDDLDKILG